tara:strand:- start:16469 stop:17821 length:1353 start_codon:yes stop_codon:yes gene_type:complete
MSGYINTIADLEAQTYGTGATGHISNQLLKAAGTVAGIHTAHDGSLSAPSGINANLYNKIYGQKVWSMLNRECNALSVISKRPYSSSGWRILKKRPAGGAGNKLDISAASNTALADSLYGEDALRADRIGGVPENASLDSNTDGLISIAPEYDTLFTSPKIIAHQFSFSELAMEMASIDDGIGDIRAQLREDMGKHHAEVQNQMLVMPLENYSPTTAYNTANAIDRGYTSLLKIISNSDEIAELADNNGGNLVDSATDQAIDHLYGKQRSDAGNEYLDSEVSFGDGYLSAEARQLTLTVLNDMIRRLRVAGGSPKVILTGYDTLQTISDLLQAQERFMDRKEIVPTVNGVRGVKGQEVGFRVSTYYDIPMIPVAAMTSTGTNSSLISDMLFLDTDHLWLSVMKPTQYFEDGISNGNPFGVGTLGNKALYRTMGEMGCSYFKGQGKITNLL